MSTFIQKEALVERAWYLVDAKGKTLGRLATTVAKCLSGKNKPTYMTNVDTGDYVVVINAEKIHVTGNKLKDKVYYHHTGYQGGIKEISLEKLLAKDAAQVIKNAVGGMLPKGPLGRKMFSKFKVYAGATHPHQAQKMVQLAV